ncbi:MAG: acetylornithine deacetylase [Aquamicrobium sp.]|uniref:acetylornithine deacetylase n=1 Tax=Aquamicrobium sp. TaxID=1872579 RepID=UPI00349E9DB9|nr:acetylornithine deacetylase [Aquamicrobium sp.]
MNLENDIRILSDLVACPSVSDRSNLDIIDYIEAYLAGHGAETRRLASPDGDKANLVARIGPDAPGGLILSGHTDVVPVEGQTWDTDPFSLTRVDDRLYGRGAADMKGFIAGALACVPELVRLPLAKPVYFCLSYDEELGCLGVHGLIDHLKERGIDPDLCIVGEPTGMEVGLAHKGNRTYRLAFTGEAAHSSRAPTVVNAVAYAARFVSAVTEEAAGFATAGPFQDGFDVPHTTVHVGVMNGGTQVNIVPDLCVVDMEIRYLPGEDADALAERFVFGPAGRLNEEMAARGAGCGVTVADVYSYPAFRMPADDPAVLLAKRCGGKNADVKLSFGTEAGCFTQAMNIPVIVCGPGDIAQAHKPDEFVTVEQLARSRQYILSCVGAICR